MTIRQIKDRDRQLRYVIEWNGRQIYKVKSWPLIKSRAAQLIHYNKLSKVSL